ncbi:branched chain amino acid aminotransferase [Polymorphobacter glacialis]|uniref:Branched chain amino acid aminotransferase n=2 Tax=Sandarakinorhabdus glacialis TaxID=1614636 RepID=A0A916ZVZ5_9SPHN|nr:branched chain amino acid aminotransferase [Polymorphobacter glacialis]
MMRSFGARADTVVSDEPFYGAYLKHTGEDQPMKEAVIASMDCDWHNVAQALSGPAPAPIWYQKHMAHHMVGPVDFADLSGFRHAFLIRAPERVIASYAAKRVTVTAADLGYARQRDWFDREAERLGQAPAVVDSADVLGDPRAVLAALCAALGIGFDPAMLHWAPGPRQSDGVWASHWYGRVLESTGFEAGEGPAPVLDAAAEKVRDACRPHYDYLAGHRLRAG